MGIYKHTHISLTVLSSLVGAAQFSQSVAAHEFFVGSVCTTGGLGSSKGRPRKRERTIISALLTYTSQQRYKLHV
jgi:hypothetical protein